MESYVEGIISGDAVLGSGKTKRDERQDGEDRTRICRVSRTKRSSDWNRLQLAQTAFDPVQ